MQSANLWPFLHAPRKLPHGLLQPVKNLSMAAAEKELADAPRALIPIEAASKRGK